MGGEVVVGGVREDGVGLALQEVEVVVALVDAQGRGDGVAAGQAVLGDGGGWLAGQEGVLGVVGDGGRGFLCVALGQVELLLE